MIKTIRLRNFKAFVDSGPIELRPLTVLAGSNSVGKSSILQSLLLLKQSLDSPEASVDLSLDGRFMHYTSVSEIAHGTPPARSARIAYDFLIETRIGTAAARRYFPTLTEHLRKPRQHRLQSRLSLEFGLGYGEERIPRVVVRELRLSSELHDTAGPSFSLRFERGHHRPTMTGPGISARRYSQGRRFLDVAGMAFIPSFLLLEEPDPESREARSGSRLAPLDPIFSAPLNDLETELSRNLHYLGPLREQPRRAYLHSGTMLHEIGQRGEYAAQVLWLERARQVNYQLPGDRKDRNKPLLQAVNEVFGYLGMPKLSVSSFRDVMYQILLPIGSKARGGQVTISDVGFGVSQLLPVVVMGLRAERGSLLVFEQPEIHLHPRLQAGLGDFFVALTRGGRRLLIETHSDHLINRLRRRVAEDVGGLSEQVSLLFVHPGELRVGAQIEPLEIDEYGMITNWPSDFMPEAAEESEAILRAGLAKRARGSDAAGFTKRGN